jgi:2-polyprenyl-3-methyl-5-hydroxy-6-metoxy-1,4-benzoquinol methylase
VDRIPEPGNTGEKMTGKTAGGSFGKSVKEFWHALLLIVPITIGWIWFLIRNVNLPKERKAELFWHMNAKNMDTFAENEGLKKFEADRNEKLEKYLPGSDYILDYGCGTGTLALRFAGRVKEIHGIDFAAGMIEVAGRKAAESGVDNARFMQATIFDPWLEKGSYDSVLAWGILHLVDDRNLVVKQIHELLKPGGLVVSATECMAEKKTPITSLLSFLLKIGIFPISLQYFTVAELEESFNGAGFQIVEKEIMGDNPVSCFIAAKKV